MTPLPKRRHSTRRSGKRKAAIKLQSSECILCKNCGHIRRPHHVCPNCGHYNGREVIVKTEKKKKSE